MIFAANWKMNINLQQGLKFLQTFNQLANTAKQKNHFVFIPPAHLTFLFQNTDLLFAGQNVSHKLTGAFTGENSAQTLKDLGAQFCLLGHSERRELFKESELMIKQKFSVLKQAGLIPILCIGESLKQKSQKEHVLKQQLQFLKEHHQVFKLEPATSAKLALIVAYEPLYAIGTAPASIEDINDSLQIIKTELPYSSVKLFYGGSVSLKNIHSFKSCKHLDGFLIGGASLEASNLYKMYQEFYNN